MVLPTASQVTAEAISPNQQLLPLTAHINDSNHLEVGGCDVVDLVEQFGSPLYILDETTLRTAAAQYRDSFRTYYPGPSQVIYASKAWSCLAVCALVNSEGLGIDVVSAGELYTALEAGVSPEVIYFHGNNKSQSELEYALQVGCVVVVDNQLELETLAALAQGQEQRPRVMIRVTPGIECHTHEYIRTGHLDSKFGFDPNQLLSVFEYLSQAPQLQFLGLHAHIGSQIFELEPHQDLGRVLTEWLAKAASYGLEVSELNIGGGLGIRYVESDDPPSIAQWVQIVSAGVVAGCEAAGVALPKLLSEPGRSLVGPACITAYRVGSRKTVPGIRTYIAVDGGMSDNPRPITYQSRYQALLANRMRGTASTTVTIAGKHCESGDILIRDIELSDPQSGDVLVVPGTGAYNYSMASNYNRVPRPAAVLVNAGEASLILRRETQADLLRQDVLPERLRG
ncbi:diaminopimelate decarboxylase [Leptolyngbya sp. FACHB-261]|uniref:diaminopimelate decarboxylase n=1 Tax=Leptolyngbya sp. FACHB-261 TaxID=2692806 RepID=UPI001682A17A|nr:diaminopimelate decarboxylase [Leptolyngbya sp. FACHB-261]MBD2105085.1 diaminopimelate decarboxylase [Leptolyngbya sp. FACHB-261]